MDKYFSVIFNAFQNNTNYSIGDYGVKAFTEEEAIERAKKRLQGSFPDAELTVERVIDITEFYGKEEELAMKED